jgi:twitching motility protein PilI
MGPVNNKAQNSVDLVDFQNRLNKSLESIHNLGELSSLLGFTSAGENWLVKLSDLHEIESVPIQEKTQRLALAKNWVMGISNFKGNIYTLIDFQVFLGQANATQTGLNARSLLINARHQIQAALVVGEVSGLVAVNDVKRLDKTAKYHWVSALYESKDGRVWKMVDVGALAQDQVMLNIAA